jgi:hypothetical protein
LPNPPKSPKIHSIVNQRGNQVKQAPIDSVLDQIQQDVANGYLTAIQEMLQHLPVEILQAFLPENIAD